MKAIYLLAAGMALTLASCSNDELVKAPESAPIAFDSYIGKVTRATDATLGNVNTITVYGYLGDSKVKLFDGTKVSNASGDWTYSPLQYWTAGKDYFFTAVSSPVVEGNTHYGYEWSETLPDATAGFCGTGTITLDNSGAAGNEDLIYSYATATTPNPMTAQPARVQFAFKHALSRVKFTFANAMGSNSYSIKVHSLTINNSAANGSLVLGTETPQWTAEGSTVLNLRDALFTPSDQIAANAASVASGTKFIIPENEKSLTISFQVDLNVNGVLLETYSHNNVTLPAISFQNGYSYNFVAELNPQNIDPEQELFPIEFTVTSVEGWTENGDTSVTLPESGETTQP